MATFACWWRQNCAATAWMVWLLVCSPMPCTATKTLLMSAIGAPPIALSLALIHNPYGLALAARNLAGRNEPDVAADSQRALDVVAEPSFELAQALRITPQPGRHLDPHLQFVQRA